METGNYNWHNLASAHFHSLLIIETESAGNHFRTHPRKARTKMQRSVESPFDWKMYLVAVLHQESANYRTARGDQSSADFPPVHRPKGCYSAGRDAADPQQSFTKEKMLPENVAITRRTPDEV